MADPSGKQSVTGIGFKPVSLVCLTSIGSGAKGLASIAFTDGETHGGMYNFGPGVWATLSGLLMFARQGQGVQQAGTVESLDEDGFTIAWEKFSSPTPTTLTIFYLALG